MRVIIKNTSRYPDHEVQWLVEFACRYVRSEMHRMSVEDGAKFDRRGGYYVEFRNKQRAAFSGRYFAQLVNERGGYPTQGDKELNTCYRRVLVKVGAPERFPLKQLTDHRYAEGDAPVGDFNDWQECAVGISAHEFAHVKYSGRKDGELNCDTIMHDAVDAFRKERHKFDAVLARTANRMQERQLALAAKRSPEAVLATREAKALKALERWNRKLKLATTKRKHYARLCARLAKRRETVQPKVAS